jgi:sugar/nucleoside kinase (ribokinase family)
VDPTGCGDVHAAAVLAGRVRGLSYAAALRLAAQVAGWQATITGWPRRIPGFSAFVELAGLA